MSLQSYKCFAAYISYEFLCSQASRQILYPSWWRHSTPGKRLDRDEFSVSPLYRSIFLKRRFYRVFDWQIMLQSCSRYIVKYRDAIGLKKRYLRFWKSSNSNIFIYPRRSTRWSRIMCDRPNFMRWRCVYCDTVRCSSLRKNHLSARSTWPLLLREMLWRSIRAHIIMRFVSWFDRYSNFAAPPVVVDDASDTSRIESLTSFSVIDTS